MSDKEEAPIVISGEKARRAEIILQKPWQRMVFVGCMVAAVIVAVLIRMAFLN